MNQDSFRIWMDAHCCCCGAERAGVVWTELIVTMPDRPNVRAWQCPACALRIFRMAAGLEKR